MFGNLFEDEEGEGLPSLFQESPDGAPLPPAPRGSTRLSGIMNQGATCFLNAGLQVLAHTPEVRDALFRLSQEEIELDKDTNNLRAIPLELRRLFASLMLEERQAVSAKDVTRSFGWKDEDVRQQHDVQELFQVLLSALTESLRGTSGKSLVQSLFEVKTVISIKCPQCNKISDRSEEDTGLFVPVRGYPGGLLESLHNLLAVPEMLTSGNEYRCEACDSLTQAQRTTKIHSLPPVLMLTLTRFMHEQGKPLKVTDRFPFPLELDISPYTEQGGRGQYELSAVVVHVGGCGGGHYTACIRDVDDLGNWENPQDLPPESQEKENDPCQLIASILKQQKTNSMKEDKLSAEVLKLTGVSWAKQYKKEHGTFKQFIRCHTNLFYVEDNMVTLLESPVTETQDWITPDVSGNISTEAQIPSTISADSGSTERGSRDNANDNCSISGPNPLVTDSPRAKAGVSVAGQHWFYFNDSSVSPMNTVDLAKQFAGQKSAYVLFYRRKNIVRPPEVRSNPQYGVPEHLVMEMRERNEALEKERAEYAEKERERLQELERQRQELQLEIAFHWNYTVKQGQLCAQCEPLPLTVTRSQTLGQLSDTITVFGSGNLEDSSFRIHRLKTVGNKVHLFEAYTERDKTLEELSVLNGTVLFVWDGCQVDGQPVVAGEDSVPITIRLKQHASSTEIVHDFPKNLRLASFHKQVSQLTGVPDAQLHLQLPKVRDGGDACSSSDAWGDDDTLESHQLTNNSAVIFSDSLGSTSDHSQLPEGMLTTEQSQFKFCCHIENRCGDEDSGKQWPVWELEIDHSMTVGEVALLFKAIYSVECDDAMLRQIDAEKGLQPPYDESLTVAQAGITATTLLVLDNMKMSLTFKQSGQSEGGQGVLHVKVDKTCTVEACLLAMMHTAGVPDSSEWHLCKTNFFGERGNVLDDMTQTLDQCGINPGDFLILQQGRLMPKGFLFLPVWLYPTLTQLGQSVKSIMNLEDLVVSQDVEKADVSTVSRSHVGDVEISKDATLEMLRFQVVELLSKRLKREVSSAELRVSLVDKRKRLRRVLRESHTTLRRLKVTAETPVGVQITSFAACPSSSEVMLTVQVRGPGQQTYSGPQEMAWNCSHSSSAAQLRHDIAGRLNAPVEAVVIAKHFPDQFAWKILKDDVQNQQRDSNRGRGRRKRGHLTKSDIRQKPFFLQDGDLVGVIDRRTGTDQLTTVSPDAFCTEEDKLGRKMQEEAQRQKQLEREARKIAASLSTHMMRRPEVPLTIRVGDYT